MENAVYYNPTKVLFGKGAETYVGRELAKHTDRVLLHYGGGSAERSGLLSRIRKSLDEGGLQYFELGGVQSNPRLSLVYEGIRICREEGVGLVLAVGGGSVIDSAKAIAVGTPNSEDVWEYFVTDKRTKTALPVATVLTLPGAGSESSMGMVITNDETNEKMAYDDDIARPIISFLNPELTYTIPPYHAAAGIIDAFTHVMERYFSKSRYVDVTDRLCEGVMRSMIKYGRRVLAEPENYDVRAEVMWACKMAHDGTLGIGRVEDWSSHMIEHELSARYDVSHGAGLAVVYPAWITYVYKNDIDRFAQFAMRVFDVEYNFDDPEETVHKGIRRLKAFFAAMGMPASMQELCGMRREESADVGREAAEHAGGGMGSLMHLDAADIAKILDLTFA